MLVDTDVLIWNLRGTIEAANRLDASPGFQISAVTYMELVHGMRDKAELRVLHRALSQWRANIRHLDTMISARASFLIEQYALGTGLRLADALIAATTLEHGLPLLTGNDRHYRAVDGLEIAHFRP
ncbi:MAG: type II toxin-antitoxin system VapC family toxin [Nitrococcus sp.]|nr:type II toxin-antitoxin system VapC family toxin [Nitrococcus sp.]